MRIHSCRFLLFLAVLLCESSLADLPYMRIEGDDGLSVTSAPAVRLDLMNGLAAWPDYGTFEDAVFQPHWQGWTSHDLSDGPVGDYAHVWSYLGDLDWCPGRSNSTPQVAFIAHPITGQPSYLCYSWCYDPEGYIVHPEGGAAGPDYHLHNEVWSPALEWPNNPSFCGAVLEFDVHRHELLFPDYPGMFYVWHVRSSSLANPDPENDGDWSDWRDFGFVYYGGPDMYRHVHDVSDLLVPDRKWVQLALGVRELGYEWGYEGQDGTPSPHFDNVAFYVYDAAGPVIRAREVDLAQDSFPARPDFTSTDPTLYSVPFNRAGCIDPTVNIPGDSLYCQVVAVQATSSLAAPPRLYYKLNIPAGSIFTSAAGCRTEVPVGGATNTSTDGWVSGVPRGIKGVYAFDLPDLGFFYPGDVIHYYIRAQDNLGGVATLPVGAEAAGSAFGNFGIYSAYPEPFVVRALPSITALGASLAHPKILFWNDYGTRGGRNTWDWAWKYALAMNGNLPGVHYDVYRTNAPSSGVGNGLGGRATDGHLAGYETILYSCGDLVHNTLRSMDDPYCTSPDVERLGTWLNTYSSGGGTKHLFMTGSNLATDLSNQGSATANFLTSWASVGWVRRDHHWGTSSIVLDAVLNAAGAVYFPNVAATGNGWTVLTGCYATLGPIHVDAVEAIGTAEVLAEYDPLTSPPPPLTAAVLHQVGSPPYAEIITLPYDLMSVTNPEAPFTTKDQVQPSARDLLLGDILLHFGHEIEPAVVGVPQAGSLAIRSCPNPFNPSTRIEYNLPERGLFSLKIYDIRGHLVKNLLEEIVDGGSGFVTWDGTDQRGAGISSGLYFAVAEGAGRKIVEKIAVVK